MKERVFLFPKHRCFKRCTALTIALLFLVTNTVMAAPLSASHKPAFSGAPLAVPSELGTIQEFYQGRSGKTIVYIQDAHDSLEAQENIAKIINLLVGKKGINTVFEEGYEGAVPTDALFGFIKDPKIREKVSYFLLDRLRIGGAEYAHINRSRDFRLIGVDDLKLYRENIRHYQNASKNKEATEEDISRLFAWISVLADRYFPKNLKILLKRKDRFHRGTLSILDYLKDLQSLYLKSGKVNSSKTFLDAYPDLSILLAAKTAKDGRIIDQLNTLDSQGVFGEMAQLERDISDALLQSGRDRQIFRYYQGLSLIQRLNRIELTSEEYEAVKKNLHELQTKKLAEFIVSQTRKPLVLSKEWEQHIQDPVFFYETAHSRDRAVQSYFKKFAGESGEDAAVLVFGGFHAEKIKKILREEDMSYYVVSPRITAGDQLHKTYYKQLMSAGHYSFENTVAPAQATRPESEFVVAITAGEGVVRQMLSTVASLASSLGDRLERSALDQAIEKRLGVSWMERNLAKGSSLGISAASPDSEIPASMTEMDEFFYRLSEKAKNLPAEGKVTAALYLRGLQGEVTVETIQMPREDFTAHRESVAFYIASLIHRRGLLIGVNAVALDLSGFAGEAQAGAELLRRAMDLLAAQFGTTEPTASFAQGIRIEKDINALYAAPVLSDKRQKVSEPVDFNQGEAIGIDFGGTNIKVTAIRGGQILLEKRIPLEKIQGQEIGEVIEQEIRSIASLYGASLLKRPIYITIPGMITPQGKIIKITNVEKGRPGTQKSLEALQSRVDLDIQFVIDASAASFFQKVTLGLKNNVIVNTLGTGLGLGILINGELIPAPQSSHLRVYYTRDYTGKNPVYHEGFGMSGDVESYANKDFVKRRTLELAAEARVEMPVPSDALTPEIVTGWLSLDEENPLKKIALQVYREFGNHLALLYNEVARVTHIQEWTVVLMGGIASGKAVDPIRAGIFEKISSTVKIDLKTGADPNWAGARGAAYLGIEREDRMRRAGLSETPRIKLLVFDLDGTLYNLAALKGAYVRAAYELYRSRYPVSFEEAREIFERKRQELRAAGKGSGDQNTLEAFGFTYAEKAANEERLIDFGVLKPLPALRPLIEQLKARYRIVIATNNNQKTSMRILEQVGLAGLFEKIYSQDVSEFHKPDKRLFEMIAAAYGSKPEEVVSIGDRNEADLAPARQAGLQTVLVRGPEDLAADLGQKIDHLEFDLKSRASSLGQRPEVSGEKESSKIVLLKRRLQEWRETVRTRFITELIAFLYRKGGVSRFQKLDTEPARPFREDVLRGLGLVRELNNVVFVQTKEGEGEQAVHDLARALLEGSVNGQRVTQMLRLDLAALSGRYGQKAPKQLEAILTLAKKAEGRVGLILTPLGSDPALQSVLLKYTDDPNILFLGLTDMGGYRVLEQDPVLASRLNFVLTDKIPPGVKRDQSVLVIGASSFLGRALYARLRRAYREVHGTDFLFKNILPPGIELLNTNSEEDIREFFEAHPGYDIVVYASGRATLDLAEGENQLSDLPDVLTVEAISKYFKGRFVYISSDYVLDGSHAPYNAQLPTAAPLNDYGGEKLQGELMTFAAFQQPVILRLGTFYGRTNNPSYSTNAGRSSIVGDILDTLLGGKPLNCESGQIKHPILLDDVAESLVKLLDHEASGIFQLNGVEGLTRYEMAQRIGEVWSRRTGQRPVFPIVGFKNSLNSFTLPRDTRMVNIDTPRFFSDGVETMLAASGIAAVPSSGEPEKQQAEVEGQSPETLPPGAGIRFENPNHNIAGLVSVGALSGYRQAYGGRSTFPQVYLLPDSFVQRGAYTAALDEVTRGNAELGRGTVIVGSSDQITHIRGYLDGLSRIESIDWSQSGISEKEQAQLKAEASGLQKLWPPAHNDARTEFLPLNVGGDSFFVEGMTIEKLPKGRYQIGNLEIDSQSLSPLKASAPREFKEPPDFGITVLDSSSFIVWAGSRGVLVNPSGLAVPLIESLHIPIEQITDVMFAKTSEATDAGVVSMLNAKSSVDQKLRIITAPVIWQNFLSRLTVLLGEEKAKSLLLPAQTVLVKPGEILSIGDAASLEVKFALAAAPALMGRITYGRSAITFSGGHIYDPSLYDQLTAQKSLDPLRIASLNDFLFGKESGFLVLETDPSGLPVFESLPPAVKERAVILGASLGASGRTSRFKTASPGETIPLPPVGLASQDIFRRARHAVQEGRAVIGSNYEPEDQSQKPAKVESVTPEMLDHLPLPESPVFKNLVNRGQAVPFGFGFSAGGMSARYSNQIQAVDDEGFSIQGLDSGGNRTLLEWKLAVARVGQQHFSHRGFPVIGMTSYLTDSKIRRLIQERDYYGFGSENMFIFPETFQRILVPSDKYLRQSLEEIREEFQSKVNLGIITQKQMDDELEAYYRGAEREWKRAGEILTRTDGSEIINPFGHFDFIAELVMSGKLAELRKRNIKFIYHSNVNNLAAVIDDQFYALQGYFLDKIEQAATPEEEPVVLVEVVANDRDLGSYPARVTYANGTSGEKLIPDEDLSSDAERKSYPFMNSGNYLFSVEGLWRLFELDKKSAAEAVAGIRRKIPFRLSHLEVREVIGGKNYVYTGLRVDQMLDDLVGFAPSVMVEVPADERFVSVKNIDDLDKKKNLLSKVLDKHVDFSPRRSEIYLGASDRRRLMEFPIDFEPNKVPFVWGGNGIFSFKGQERRGFSEKIGESWEVSGHSKHPSRLVLANGRSVLLSEILENPKVAEGILGKKIAKHTKSSMPFIFKLLDVHEMLSVQVHPSDAVALRLNEPDPGKEEDFMVLSTHEEGENVFYLGLQERVTLDEFEEATRSGKDLRGYLNKVLVKAGDVFRVPPGVPHAWGSGVILVEIAQPSDLTYRLYDYGDSRKRPLHIEQGLQSINFESARGNELVRSLRPSWLPQPDDHVQEVPIHPSWRLERVTFKSNDTSSVNFGPNDRFHVVMAIAGEVEITAVNGKWKKTLEQGYATLIPAGAGEYSIKNAVPDHNSRALRLSMTLPEESKVNIAISMGGTKMALGIVGTRGLLGEEERFIWRDKLNKQGTELNPEAIVQLFSDQIVGLLKKFDLEPGYLEEIGIAWPGPGDYEKGIVSATFVPGFSNYPLKAKLEEKLSEVFGRPIRVNILLDAMAGLKGERNSVKGGMRGVDNGMVLNLATGAAAGLWSNGQIIDQFEYQDPQSGYSVDIKSGMGQLGRHLVRMPDGQWVYRPTPNGTVAEEFIKAQGGTRLTDWVGGPALARRFVQYVITHKTVRSEYFGSSIEEIQKQLQARNEKVEYEITRRITELAKDKDQTAIDFITETGSDIGKALKVFLSSLPQFGFGERIVIYGGIGENLGKGLYDPGDSETDLFMRAIQKESGVANIVRSQIGIEREFLGFQPQGKSLGQSPDKTIVRDAKLFRSPAEVLRDERAGQMIRDIARSNQAATVFVNAEDFPSLSEAQKNEYFYAALCNKEIRIVVYNERGQVRDKKLNALLALNRVSRTDKNFAEAQISFDLPHTPNIHLSKKIVPSDALVRRLQKKVAFFRERDQKSGTLTAALLWAWSGERAPESREITQGKDGFWTVAETLIDAIQKSYENNIIFLLAA